MISSILPGIREARPALSGGFMWLAFITLITAANNPGVLDDAETYASEDISALADYLGPVSLIVVTGFVAYLLGALLQAAATNLVRYLGVGHLLAFPRPDTPPTGLSRVFRPLSGYSKLRVFEWASWEASQGERPRVPRRRRRRLWRTSDLELPLCWNPSSRTLLI